MTAFAIKIIASISMLADHIGVVFPTLAIALILRRIGRIAFPVYAYFIASGCKHTSNINKYMLRLGIFALITEIPFDLAFFRNAGNPEFTIDYLDYTNVYYTLFLGVACINLYQRIKDLLPASAPIFYKGAASIAAIAATTPILLCGNLLGVDYGMYGVIYILIFYLADPQNKLTRTIAAAIIVFIEYAYPYFYGVFGNLGVNLFTFPGKTMYVRDSLSAFWCAFIAVGLIYLYNGRQGPKAGLAFYLFYPVHIAVLCAVWYILRA